jgi:hypothetical protein
MISRCIRRFMPILHIAPGMTKHHLTSWYASIIVLTLYKSPWKLDPRLFFLHRILLRLAEALRCTKAEFKLHKILH